jgi:murein DD-endopeptidase
MASLDEISISRLGAVAFASRLFLFTFISIPVFGQIAVSIPFAPIPVSADGRTYLAYELHVTNFTTLTGKLDRVEVFSEGSPSVPLATYHDKQLADSIFRPGLADGADTQALGGGLRAIVFIWLSVKRGDPLPAALLHKLSFQVPGNGGEKPQEVIFDGGRVPVRKEEPFVISAPLRGSGWVAGNGPSNTSVHRRNVFPFSYRTTVSERFAIDFVKLGEDGMAMKGDKAKNDSFYGYGTDVLAVADGVVWAMHDGMADNNPFSKPAAQTEETSGGNYVTIDLGHGRFAFYAHLKTNSVRVKQGERVRRGQVLGMLGNSGNTDAPHLHFQISGAGKPGQGEGLPFVFDSFDFLGQTDLLAALELDNRQIGWKSRPDVARSLRHKEIPLENAVIAFP